MKNTNLNNKTLPRLRILVTKTCLLATLSCPWPGMCDASYSPKNEENKQVLQRHRQSLEKIEKSLDEDEHLTREQHKALQLQRFDKNGNGKLDTEEIENLARNRYLRWDLDGDGSVSKIEREEKVKLLKNRRRNKISNEKMKEEKVRDPKSSEGKEAGRE